MDKIIYNGTYFVITEDEYGFITYVKAQNGKLIQLGKAGNIEQAYKMLLHEAEISITDHKNTIIEYQQITGKI
jgi:hypothetical protein